MELASRPQDAIRLAERALFVLTIQMVQHERRENATKTVALIRKRPCHPRSDLESKTLVARFGCRKPKNLQIAVDTVDVGGRRNLASLTPASWNRITAWLRTVDELRLAA